MSLPFTKYLVPPGDHRWLVGRGVLVNPEPTAENPEPVRAADDLERCLRQNCWMRKPASF